MRRKLTSGIRITLCLLLALCSVLVYPFGRVSAEQIQNRSLTISTSVGGVIAQHIVSFQLTTTDNVGSFELKYCTSPVETVTCVAPNGLDASGAVFSSQSGETGFSVLSQSANEIILSRPAAVTGPQQNSYTFDNVINPSDIGAFFLRITSYASVDASGPALDFGATAGSITQSVTINAEVPPILEFCVGITIQGFCTVVDGTFLDLGVLDSSRASAGTSRFQAYTNAEFGYVVTVSGATMISGNKVITALATPTPSTPGVRQFGINLRANTIPAVGADPVIGNGIVSPDYNSPNLFTYNDGDVLVTNPGIGDFETFTVTYLVNVQPNQTPGIYNTILNYTCTATF